MTNDRHNATANQHAVEFSPGESAKRHWERLLRHVNIHAAAATFAALMIVAGVLLGLLDQEIKEFYYDVNREVNYRDMHELNEYGDYVLNGYLAGESTGGREAVLLGASYTAASDDIGPEQRLHQQLAGFLNEGAPTGASYQVVNLATDGYDTWSLFYVARLLRLRRPPELLIVSPDILHLSDRSKHLVLNVGVGQGVLEPDELAPVVPYNNQLLYVSEANAKASLREGVPGLKAFTYLSTSYPKRETITRWFKFTWGYLRGEDAPLTAPANRHADGTHKSWQEVAESKAMIEEKMAKGSTVHELTPPMMRNLELLGLELAKLQDGGTQVLVLTMPRNPVVPLDPLGADEVLEDWAKRYGLPFHNYWESGLIPTEYYKDTGHFFGEGSKIMAREIAQLVAGEEGRQ